MRLSDFRLTKRNIGTEGKESIGQLFQGSGALCVSRPAKKTYGEWDRLIN